MAESLGDFRYVGEAESLGDFRYVGEAESLGDFRYVGEAESLGDFRYVVGLEREMNENTLEPPGSIAIVMDEAGGRCPTGDAWGVELMLYARYLGFHAKLFSPAGFDVINSDGAVRSATSPLGLAALAAQKGLGETMSKPEISCVTSWYEQYLLPLVASDLIGEHIETGCQLEAIEQANLEQDPAASDLDDDDSDLPPDFLIRWRDVDGEHRVEQFEAVVDARRAEDLAKSGATESVPEPRRLLSMDVADYHFRLGWFGGLSADAELLEVDFSRIRQFFAELTDRPELDVYANLGGFA